MVKTAISLLVGIFCINPAQADVQFHCPTQSSELQQDLRTYLHSLKVPDAQVIQTLDTQADVLTIALATAPEDTNTLDFSKRAEFALTSEALPLPTAHGNTHIVRTVSKKEILLALLQHGRLTAFDADHCSVDALADHVGVRQNIVAWAEKLNWVWPNGKRAKWNPKYWIRGTPKLGTSVQAAVMDVFIHQEKYAIGCYTATKLVFVQGLLDYYQRVKKDPTRLAQIKHKLLVDGEPLAGIEPSRMWSFEQDFDAQSLDQPGKLLVMHTNIAPHNFVPGDWGYILNTDAATAQKTGYEGSNAVYLGRNRFDDYYDDNGHGYTFEQKLDEVYQWRHGVFSRSRDAQKIKPLTPEAQDLLSSTPLAGGILLDMRVVPEFY